MNTKLYVATNELLKILPLYEKHISHLVPDSIIKNIKKQGDAFDKLITNNAEADKEREQIALNSIGACTRCDKILTKNHIKNKLCEKIMDKMYCKDCINIMHTDGSMTKLIKENNMKNGRT